MIAPTERVAPDFAAAAQRCSRMHRESCIHDRFDAGEIKSRSTIGDARGQVEGAFDSSTIG